MDEKIQQFKVQRFYKERPQWEFFYLSGDGGVKGCLFCLSLRRFFQTGITKYKPMGLKCGIVGLPNVGKSTLFNALTSAKALAANYPFATKEPNIGMITVPDPRLDELAKLVNPQRIVPTTVEILDIAGLIKGASKGEGLGNQFLGNIREVDAIIHVVRCFENENVVHIDETLIRSGTWKSLTWNLSSRTWTPQKNDWTNTRSKRKAEQRGPPGGRPCRTHPETSGG